MSFIKSHVLFEERTLYGIKYLLVHDDRLDYNHFQRNVYLIRDPVYINRIKRSCNKIYITNNIIYSGIITSRFFGEMFYDKFYNTITYNNNYGEDINDIVNPFCICCDGINASQQNLFSLIPKFTHLYQQQPVVHPTNYNRFISSRNNPVLNTMNPVLNTMNPVFNTTKYVNNPYEYIYIQDAPLSQYPIQPFQSNVVDTPKTRLRPLLKNDTNTIKPTKNIRNTRLKTKQPIKLNYEEELNTYYDEELKTYKIIEENELRHMYRKSINKVTINSPNYGLVSRTDFPNEIDLNDYIITEDVKTDDYYEDTLKRAIEESMSTEQKANKYIDSMKDIVSAYSVATTITFRYNPITKSYVYDLKMTENDIPENEVYKCPICMEIINTSLINKKNKDNNFIIVSPCECTGTEGLMHRTCYIECIKNEAVGCKIYCQKPFKVPSIIDISTYRIMLESYRHLLK
jgi:hypothetical protein